MSATAAMLILPYSRIVGREQIKLALEIAYVNPQRLCMFRLMDNEKRANLQLCERLPINASKVWVVGNWKIDVSMWSKPKW